MKWIKLQREIKISYCPSKNSKLNPEPNINVVENRKQKQVDLELNIRKTENKVSAYLGYLTTDHINCGLRFGIYNNNSLMFNIIYHPLLIYAFLHVIESVRTEVYFR